MARVGDRAWALGLFGGTTSRPFGLLAVALLCTHELDAVQAREWRDLPLLNLITNEEAARATFIAAHVPIFLGVFAGLASPRTRGATLTAVSAFGIIHVGLHALLERETRKYYSNVLSRGLIYGSGLAGLADILLSRQ
jgi:hypothetical protein